MRLSISRHPAEEGAGATGAAGEEGAGGKRRGHHPVPAHRRGILGLRGRLGVRGERLVGLTHTHIPTGENIGQLLTQLDLQPVHLTWKNAHR